MNELERLLARLPGVVLDTRRKRTSSSRTRSRILHSGVVQAAEDTLTTTRELPAHVRHHVRDGGGPAPLPLALSTVPRGHPPLLDYLPAVLTPAQESYIKRRKAQERAMGIPEILELRKAVAEKTCKKAERDAQAQMDTQIDVEDAEKKPDEPPKSAGADVEMDTEDADGDRDSVTLGTAASTKEMAEEMKKEKEEPPVVPADGDDAVEY
ncbi:hypothetical protein K438DRAFT_2091801 [Mycena galopus ATCC 62051]|nr:hypothetical protein K438DRAFT_2091801 [Mycena galopus ATCC 62051]